MALHKGFVFNNWFHEAVNVFHDPRVASFKIVDFTRFLGLAFRDDIWLVHTRHCTYMKKHRLIPLGDLAPILVPGLLSRFSASVVDLLGVVETFSVCFGFCKHVVLTDLSNWSRVESA
ncbi:hypothetical protein G9A89_012866 [Geosiphon pyriformis]|nr:hypothetical protein G9A89_012866 [Geosiphon pyriformis]